MWTSIDCGGDSVTSKPAKSFPIVEKVNFEEFFEVEAPCLNCQVSMIPFLWSHLAVQLFFKHGQHLLINRLARGEILPAPNNML